MKKILIGIIIKLVFGTIALGVGIWYVSHSLGGASLSYVSMDNFISSIGVQDGNIATTNGCFMCTYINDLFTVLGEASEKFWDVLLEKLWVLLVVGFGIYLVLHSIKYIFDKTKELSDPEKVDEDKVELKELKLAEWFEPVKDLLIKLLVVGAVLGAFSMGGIEALRTLTDIIIRPIMFIGAQLSMVATGVSDYTQCNPGFALGGNAMAPISGSFMCIIGNINAVMLGGAAGGFTLMNYAWMGLGGGLFTWVSGLALVIVFMMMGFDLFFQLLSVVFKLILLIIFLPIFVASYAFEKVWSFSKDLTSKTISMLVNASIRVIAITLKVVIMYSIVYYAADSYFPGPVDGYSAILPNIMGVKYENIDSKTLSVMNVYNKCEKVSLKGKEIDKDTFKQCFIQERRIVEEKYPGAFNFAGDGWGFLVFMFGLFFLYFYVLNPRIDSLLTSVNVGKEPFDNFGDDIKKFGISLFNKPKDFANAINEKKNK